MKFICECGSTNTVRNLAEIMVHFRAKDCFPGMVTFLCDCGAELRTGPDEGLNPIVRAQRDLLWEESHKNHREVCV